MHDLRGKLIASGLLGLVGCAILTLLAVYAITSGAWPGLGWGLPAWIAYLFLMSLALVEMPLMIIALRRVAAEGAGRLLAVINAVYVFFPVVYGLPLVLATGTLPAGLSICALSPLRLVAALVWVRQD
jgi:heme/copper-type cytochrome/quinol oxidase subunit 4